MTAIENRLQEVCTLAKEADEKLEVDTWRTTRQSAITLSDDDTDSVKALSKSYMDYVAERDRNMALLKQNQQPDYTKERALVKNLTHATAVITARDNELIHSANPIFGDISRGYMHQVMCAQARLDIIDAKAGEPDRFLNEEVAKIQAQKTVSPSPDIQIPNGLPPLDSLDKACLAKLPGNMARDPILAPALCPPKR